MSAHSLKCRKRLNAARFFYGQMKSEFQDRIIFHYLLDAFVASARSVTHVFQAEFNDNEYLMRWYQKRRKEWRQNEIMKFFKKLRNVSLKEHTPDTQTRSSIKWGINVIFSDKDVKKVVDSNGKEHWVTPLLPLEVIDKEIVGYAFLHDFKWFDKSPDVMALCKEYLEELDRFVSEVENMVGREEREQV